MNFLPTEKLKKTECIDFICFCQYPLGEMVGCLLAPNCNTFRIIDFLRLCFLFKIKMFFLKKKILTTFWRMLFSMHTNILSTLSGSQLYQSLSRTSLFLTQTQPLFLYLSDKLNFMHSQLFQINYWFETKTAKHMLVFGI